MSTSPFPTATAHPYSGGPPADYLTDVLEHMTTLTDRPTPAQARAEAVNELVATFPDAAQERQRSRWGRSLLDGTPVEDASADELRVEALALLGWARDRATNGLQNRGCWVWSEAARDALRTYHPSAAPPGVK